MIRFFLDFSVTKLVDFWSNFGPNSTLIHLSHSFKLDGSSKSCRVFFRNIFTKDFDRRLASTSHLGLGVKFDTSLNFFFVSREFYRHDFYSVLCVWFSNQNELTLFIELTKKKREFWMFCFEKTEKCKQWRIDRKLTLCYVKISKYGFCFSNLWFYKFFSKCWLPNIFQVRILLKIWLKFCENGNHSPKYALLFSSNPLLFVFYLSFFSLQNKMNFFRKITGMSWQISSFYDFKP